MPPSPSVALPPLASPFCAQRPVPEYHGSRDGWGVGGGELRNARRCAGTYSPPLTRLPVPPSRIPTCEGRRPAPVHALPFLAQPIKAQGNSSNIGFAAGAWSHRTVCRICTTQRTERGGHSPSALASSPRRRSWMPHPSGCPPRHRRRHASSGEKRSFDDINTAKTRDEDNVG